MAITVLKFLICLPFIATIYAQFSNDVLKHCDFLIQHAANNQELAECSMKYIAQYRSYLTAIEKNLDFEQISGKKPFKFDKLDPYCIHSCYFQSTGTWDEKGRLLNKEKALDLFKLTKNPYEALVSYVLVFGVPGQDDQVVEGVKPKKTGPVDMENFKTQKAAPTFESGWSEFFSSDSYSDDSKEEKEKLKLEEKLRKNVEELFSKSILDNVVQVCNDKLDRNITDMCEKARAFWACFNQNFMGSVFYILTKVNLTKTLPENKNYYVKMEGFDNFYDINEKFVYNNYKLKFMKTGNIIMGNTVLPKIDVQDLPTTIKKQVDLWVNEKKYM